MTRPEIIRADSIDLQDHDAPSAQFHPARPSPLQTKQSPAGASSSTFAPHQAETLREVAAETAEEESRSPRVSWANGGAAGDLQQYAKDLAAGVTSSLNGHSQIGDHGDSRMAARAQQDDLAVAQNGGLVSQNNTDDGDVDGEEGDLDDDMMDKISSSPSIDDGGSTCQLPSFSIIPQPDASPCSSPVSASACFSEARSSPPYLNLPDYSPLQQTSQQHGVRGPVETPRHHHHHRHILPGAFPEDLDDQTSDHEFLQAVDQGAVQADVARGGFQRHSRDESTVQLAAESKWASGQTTKADNLHGHLNPNPLEDNTDEAIFINEDEGGTKDGLIVPYEGSTDDDDDDDLFFQSTNPRFIDSGWGGDCLHDAEDIDFELVYALHTFIATVEGQANATKGDAMVLLDDSNSYWWLVRVVKDSSIGYLPAEHIETPTERLARLNKHRNIDLSATMLGDQAEKAKNPIKTAMRRRKAKNVSFAAPTFVDYSDYDYDTEDEEDAEAEILAQQQQQQQQSQQQASTAKQTNGDDGNKEPESAKVAPLKARPQQKSVQVVDPAKADAGEDTTTTASKPTGRTSEEIFETNGVEGPKKKPDGTVRDSFFKDDTVETKKITLTPNLLRDDGTVRESSDSIDRGIIKRPSFDKLDKDVKEDKKRGKEKKEKDKKGGFRGLFSRGKDKKQRGDEDAESFGKRSMDIGSESTERPSEDIGDDMSLDKAGVGLQRNTSKLQKQQPRVEPSLARKPGGPKENGSGMDLSTFLNENSLKSVSSVPPASMRIVDPDADLFEDDDDDEEESPKSQPSTAAQSASGDDYKPNATRQAPARSMSADKPSKTTAAKSRMQLGDSDSEEEVREIAQTSASVEKAPEQLQPEQQPRIQEQQKSQRPLPGAFPDSYISVVSAESTSTITADKAAASHQRSERLSESPVEVSPVTPPESQPPALTGDNSSQEDHSSPVSSPSPELIDREEAAGTHRNQDSITTSTSTTTVSTWNDTSLRAFFDSGTDIRDLLMVVYDKNDVEPVGSDHPVAGTLFKEQNAKLAEITTQLDNMLGDWLARKQRLRGTV